MRVALTSALLALVLLPCTIRAAETNSPTTSIEEQNWNWHLQSTAIIQGTPSFPAKYSGPNSLLSDGEIRDTVSLDLIVGARLWRGAEAHVDGLVWQGFGLSRTVGIESFPNGEAFHVGTRTPNFNFCRVFVRQTIGLGGEQEQVEDDALTLAGKRDISRITFTFGRISVKDIFDNNTYANDPRTQFMSWGLMANEAWDFPADSLGYMSGFAAELNQPQWAVRYGVFQMPRESNGTALDWHLLNAWGMVSEFERRFAIKERPGAVRVLAYLNRAHMGSYQDAVDSPIRPADIVATRDYRFKYGFGLNAEQEIIKNLGAFTRLGWNDGHNEGWTFADVDHTVTFGLSLKGESWNRTNDTFAIAGAFNGASIHHQRYLAAGGTGILDGDGALTYGWEKSLETYYNLNIWKTIQATFDYQFVTNPAYNRDRGPVSVFAFRLRWTY
jgi:high affinity Mn2+ porin